MQVCKGPPPAQRRRTNLFHRLSALTERAAVPCPTESHLLQSCPLCPACLRPLRKPGSDRHCRLWSSPAQAFSRENKPRPGTMHSNTGMQEHWNLLRGIVSHQPFIPNTLHLCLGNANSAVNPSLLENLQNCHLRNRFMHSETEGKKCFSDVFSQLFPQQLPDP